MDTQHDAALKVLHELQRRLAELVIVVVLAAVLQASFLLNGSSHPTHDVQKRLLAVNDKTNYSVCVCVCVFVCRLQIQCGHPNSHHQVKYSSQKFMGSVCILKGTF